MLIANDKMAPPYEDEVYWIEERISTTHRVAALN